MQEILFIGLGGFLGACLRFVITKLTAGWVIFVPSGTLLANVIACFFIGFIVGLDRNSTLIPAAFKKPLTVGLLGGLSTFSAFSMETIDLFKADKALFGISNISLNLGLSLISVLVGLVAAKALINSLFFT
ncbi:MAG: fluoride efflux transporter FluC [Bacillota bacterium]